MKSQKDQIIESQEQEINEQARLLGMSAEREASLRSEIDQLKRSIAEWQRHVDKLNRRNADKTEEIERLKTDNDALRAAVDQVRIHTDAEIERLQGEIEDWRIDRDQLREAVAQRDHTIRLNYQETEILVRKIHQLQADIANSETHPSHPAYDKIERLKDENNVLTQAMEAHDIVNEAIMRGLEEEIERLKSDLEDARSIIQKAVDAAQALAPFVLARYKEDRDERREKELLPSRHVLEKNDD